MLAGRQESRGLLDIRCFQPGRPRRRRSSSTKRLERYRKVDAVKTTFGSVMLRPVGDQQALPAIGQGPHPWPSTPRPASQAYGRLARGYRAQRPSWKKRADRRSSSATSMQPCGIGYVTGWMDGDTRIPIRHVAGSAFNWIASQSTTLFASGRSEGVERRRPSNSGAPTTSPRRAGRGWDSRWNCISRVFGSESARLKLCV